MNDFVTKVKMFLNSICDDDDEAGKDNKIAVYDGVNGNTNDNFFYLFAWFLFLLFFVCFSDSSFLFLFLFFIYFA